MDRRTLPAHETCHHAKYWLTCEQYESLIAEAQNRCQTCGSAARDCPPKGKLVIDHDYGYGVWAVRGLLCGRCNSLLTSDSPTPDWASAYLADPWFKRTFAEIGVSVDRLPEPPIGSRFKSPRGTTWVRGEDCWQNESFARSRRDWHGMCRDFSPADLRRVMVAAPPSHTSADVVSPGEPAAIAERLRAHLTPQQLRELISRLSD